MTRAWRISPGRSTSGYLQLKGTAVGDAGVVRLKGLTKLKELTLDRTGITDAGLA